MSKPDDFKSCGFGPSLKTVKAVGGFMKDNYKSIDLQMFAEDESAAETETTAEQETEQPEGKTYTDKEVDEIVSKKLARKQKEFDKLLEAEKTKAAQDAVTEAEKLRKMNEEQRKQYETEKAEREKSELQNRIAQLEREAARNELSKTAAKILEESHKIIATQELLDFVVGDTAEETQAQIDKFVKIHNDINARAAQEKARGKTPVAFGQGKAQQDSYFEAAIGKYRK